MGIKEELAAAQEIQQLRIKTRRAWGEIFSCWFQRMKLMIRYQRKQLFMSISLMACLAVIAYFSYELYIKTEIKTYRVQQIMSAVEKDSVITGISKENIEFMYALAVLESDGRFDVCSASGTYWGAFQFGPSARESVGLKGIDKKVFLQDTALQLWAMDKLICKNYVTLIPYITKYKVPMKGGVKIHGQLCTISGLLAASHLVGVNAVIDFINTGNVKSDGNGVPLTKYFQLNNYKITVPAE